MPENYGSIGAGTFAARLMTGLMNSWAARHQTGLVQKREDELRLEAQERQDALIASERGYRTGERVAGEAFTTARDKATADTAAKTREDIQQFTLDRDTISHDRMVGEGTKEFARRIELLERQADLNEEAATADFLRLKEINRELKQTKLELLMIQHKNQYDERIGTQVHQKEMQASGFAQQTGERIGGQEFLTGERQAREAYGTKERLANELQDQLMQGLRFGQRDKEAGRGRVDDWAKLGFATKKQDEIRAGDRTQRWAEIGYAAKRADEVGDRAFNRKMVFLGAQYGYDVKMLKAKVAAIPKPPANPENIQMMYPSFRPGDVSAVAELIDSGGYLIHEAARIQAGEVTKSTFRMNEKIASNLQSMGKDFDKKVFDSDEARMILNEAGIAGDSIKDGVSYSVDELIQEAAKSIDSPNNLLDPNTRILGLLESGIYTFLYATQFGEDPPGGWDKFKDFWWRDKEERGR